MNALTTDRVVKRYSNHLALDSVSITVPERSIYGLLGPNGAGKTTLIRIINQIINSDSGDVVLFGERLRPDHIGVIGYLPEERGLYKKLKVGEQLVYLARLKGLSHSDATQRIKAWLEKFEIKDWWSKKIEDLSKGMAQKVQFISTVMHEPRLIILDEPFSGFDPVNAQLITEEILQLRARGSTIIFSTHRMETVEDLCDNIGLINKSKLILEGTKKGVKAQYKTNNYAVTHRGAFQFDNGTYELVNQNKVEDDFHQSVVKSSGNPNALIQELTRLTEVHAFAEKIPTMSEIFITLVKGENHE